MSVWKYLFRFSFRNLKQNSLMNIVAVGTTALALFITSGVLLVHQNVSTILTRLKEQTPVIVYLEDTVDKDRASDLQEELLTRDDVIKVSYRSKKEAWEEFKRSVNLQGELLAGLSRNPLPASLHVHLESSALNQVEDLAGEIGGWSGVESVDYGKEIINRLQGLGQVIQVILGGIGVVICIVAVFIIFNTIRLSVVSSATEIDILKLVGATRKFIAFPFVFGGVIYGLLGSLIGQGLLWFFYWLVQSRIATLEFLPLNLHFLSPLWILVVLVVGTLLGVIGSVTAVRRAVGRM